MLPTPGAVFGCPPLPPAPTPPAPPPPPPRLRPPRLRLPLWEPGADWGLCACASRLGARAPGEACCMCA
eukprot:7297353-Pyramimonas_sp.AAC.1